MKYTLLVIILIFMLYTMFLYKLYNEHEQYMIETFDANHCPYTGGDDSINDLQVNDAQFIQREKQLNKEALKTLYKVHTVVVWIVDPFLKYYHRENSPSRTPGILIWCFATWTDWVSRGKISDCHLSISVPVIFTTILCDFQTLSYEEIKGPFGYMIGTIEEYHRFKKIYTNAANLRSQSTTMYQESHVCDGLRLETAYKKFVVSINEDIKYFVNKCLFKFNGTYIPNGKCRIPPNKIVIPNDLFTPPPQRRRRGCTIS